MFNKRYLPKFRLRTQFSERHLLESYRLVLASQWLVVDESL